MFFAITTCFLEKKFLYITYKLIYLLFEKKKELYHDVQFLRNRVLKECTNTF